MTRAASTLRWYLNRHIWRRIFTREFWETIPRPGYCERCRDWCWLTQERPCYTSATAFLCEECAIDEENEWAHFYASFY